jgi:hypothetical protein
MPPFSVFLQNVDEIPGTTQRHIPEDDIHFT